VKSESTVQRQKAAKRIPDEEFYAPLDKALKDDGEHLEKLASV